MGVVVGGGRVDRGFPRKKMWFSDPDEYVLRNTETTFNACVVMHTYSICVSYKDGGIWSSVFDQSQHHFIGLKGTSLSFC